jgi:hypothetical protein
MKLCYLEEFQTRDDLIDSLLASVHIPFFLDGNGSFKYKGETFIDGSIFDFFFGASWVIAVWFRNLNRPPLNRPPRNCPRTSCPLTSHPLG